MNQRPGLIWEPRAFWDVLRLQNAVNADGTSPIPVPVEGAFRKEFFRNEGRWPIFLDRVLLCGVGYLFREFDGFNAIPAGFGDFGACSSVVQKAEIQISVPNRQHYSKVPLQLNSLQALAVDDVSMRYAPNRAYASGLHNVCRWDFRPPTWLARDPSDQGMGLERGSACEFWCGTYVQYSNAPAPGVAVVLPNSLPLHLAFHEEGAGHYGSRQFPANAHSRWHDGVVQAAANAALHPFPAADGILPLNANQPQQWPGVSALQIESFKQQEAAVAGYNVIRGFSAHIDQIAFDDVLQTSAAPNVAGSPIERLATRIPTRARSDAGSQEWWWRPNAPLALVSPSLTPALVYKLPEPLVLHPGDVIEPRMRIPAGLSGIGAIPPDNPGGPGTSIFQVGLSFTGYAAVKGV